MLRKSLGLVALTAGMLNLASDCSTRVQDPRYLFESGDMPPALEAAANPKPKLSLRDASLGQEVLVAVIDNGVDYLHPMLENQIDFDSMDGRITGSGLDVLGGDTWPHPRLIDARPFAFGSPVVEGKIDWRASKAVAAGFDDPYSYYSALNDAIIDSFLARLKKEPRWNKSLLRKISKNSLSALGLYNLAHKDFTAESYEFIEKSGNFLSEEIINSYQKSSFLQKKRYILDQPWIMDARSGLPWSLDDYLFYVPEGHQFSLWVKQIWSELDAEYDFSDSLAALEEYALVPEVPSQTASDMDTAKESLRIRLHTSWYKNRFGHGFNNELVSSMMTFCEALPEHVYNQLQDGTIDEVAKRKLLRSELDKMLSLAEAYDLEVNRAGEAFDREDRIEALQRIKSKEIYKTLVETTWDTDSWKLYSCHSETILDYLSEQQKAYKTEYRSLHLANASMPLHGTHVAGTIAYQNSRIKIVPVRVLTSGTRYSNQNNRSFRVDFLRQWNHWIAGESLQPFLKEALPEVFGKPIDPVKVFSKVVAEDVFANALDYRFLDQLIEGVEYVGAREIPIANVSLGTEFSKSYGIYDREDQDENIEDFFGFLKYEFFKYMVGRAMQESAQSTLFVVAAGNSGKWVDGKSRTALPCDITSPFFQPVKGKKIYMPNNHVENILCVGSLDKSSKLSSFSNLVLGKTPLVFARGEAILAPVTSGSCKGTDQQFEKAYPEKMLYSSLAGSEASEAILIKLGQLEPRDEVMSDYDWENKVRTAAIRFVDHLKAGLPIIKGQAKSKACMDNPSQVAYLTGTSMATPSVAGYIADFVLREDLQEYTPKQLISKLMTKSVPYGGRSILKDVPVINGIKLLNDER